MAPALGNLIERGQDKWTQVEAGMGKYERAPDRRHDSQMRDIPIQHDPFVIKDIEIQRTIAAIAPVPPPGVFFYFLQ